MSSMHKRFHRSEDYPKGFTLVEMIIVVVIVAILVTLVVIAYSAIQNNARKASLESDTSNAASMLEAHHSANRAYPWGPDLVNDEQGLKRSNDTVYEYNSNEISYCLTATNSKVAGLPTLHISNVDPYVRQGACDNVTVGDVYMSDFSSGLDGWAPVTGSDFSYNYSQGNASISTSNEQQYQGKRSLKINYNVNVKYGLVGKVITGLTPGETYSFRAKIYVPSGLSPDLAGGLLFVGDPPGGDDPGSLWVTYYGGNSYGFSGHDRWVAMMAEVEVATTSVAMYVGAEVYNSPLGSAPYVYYSDMSVTNEP